MNQIHTRIRVGSDHRITGVAPPEVPAGEHEVTITLASPPQQMPTKKFSVKDLPTHDIPWDDSISLHREDLYADDGR
jgi:hypothetical protein